MTSSAIQRDRSDLWLPISLVRRQISSISIQWMAFTFWSVDRTVADLLRNYDRTSDWKLLIESFWLRNSVNILSSRFDIHLALCQTDHCPSRSWRSISLVVHFHKSSQLICVKIMIALQWRVFTFHSWILWIRKFRSSIPIIYSESEFLIANSGRHLIRIRIDRALTRTATESISKKGCLLWWLESSFWWSLSLIE